MDYFTINGIRYTIDDDVPTKTILVMLRKILDSKVTVFNNNLEDTVANNGKNPNDISETIWSDLQKYIVQGFKRTSDVPSELQTPLQNEVYLMNAEVGDTSKVLLNLINNNPTTVTPKNVLQTWLTDLSDTVSANASAPTSGTTGTDLQRYVWSNRTSINTTNENLSALQTTVNNNAEAPRGNQSPLQNYAYANRNNITANANAPTSATTGTALQKYTYENRTMIQDNSRAGTSESTGSNLQRQVYAVEQKLNALDDQSPITADPKSVLQTFITTLRNDIDSNATTPTSATAGTDLQKFVYTMSTDQEALGNNLNLAISDITDLTATVNRNAEAPRGNQSPLQNYAYANRNTINANAAEATSSSSGSALQRQVYYVQTVTNKVRNATRFVGLGKFFNESARNSISNISTSYFNSDGSVGSSSSYDYIINKSSLDDVYIFTWKISIKTGAVLQFTDEPITLSVPSLNYGTVEGTIGFICLPYIEIQDANWYDIDTPFVKTENLNNFNIKFLCTGKTPCLDNNSSIKKMYLPVLRDGNRICWNFTKYTDVETNSIKLGVYGGDLNIIF